MSKLYYQVYLEKSAWPFSLFWYHDSLDSKVEPDIWVLVRVRAWYGITHYALVKLAEMCGSEFPIAKDCLEKDRYVDVIPTGQETEEGREEQIRQVVEVLDKLTFSLVLSRINPPPFLLHSPPFPSFPLHSPPFPLSN